MSVFEKRHYEKLAEIMRNRRIVGPATANEQWVTIVYALGAEFGRGNPRFKRDRFEAACGLTVGKEATHEQATDGMAAGQPTLRS